MSRQANAVCELSLVILFVCDNGSTFTFLEQYHLTEEELCQILLPHFGWLVNNELAALSYPESEDACLLLHRKGIRALLNLAECPLPQDWLMRVGLRSTHIPVVGFTAPTLAQVNQSMTMIFWHLKRGLPVAVMCVAGLGRTGTILACYLVSQGHSAGNAMASIRAWRPGSIEVSEQEAVVYEYEHFVMGASHSA